MLNKDFHLTFCEGLFRVLDMLYIIEDTDDICVKYNVENRRLDYYIRVDEYRRILADNLQSELNPICRVDYSWIGFNAGGMFRVKEVKDGTKVNSRIKLYIVIYPTVEVSKNIIKNRIHKLYTDRDICSENSLMGTTYKKVCSDIEKTLTEKEFVVSYKSKEGRVCKDVIYSYTSDEAYYKFYKKYSQYKENVDFFDLEIFEQGNFDDMVIEPEPKMVYSESLDEDVIAGFTIEDEEEGTMHYTWHDEDCVYYWDDSDESFYMEVPKGAKLDY